MLGTGFLKKLQKIASWNDSPIKQDMQPAFFIDKSRFLIPLINNSRTATQFLRPNDFGKTTVKQMLTAFLSASYQIDICQQKIRPKYGCTQNTQYFTGGTKKINENKVVELRQLQIANDQNKSFFDKHHAQYPVISLNLKKVEGQSYDVFRQKLKQQITRLYKQHIYLFVQYILSFQLDLKNLKQFVKNILTQNEKLERDTLIWTLYQKMKSNKEIQERIFSNFYQIRQFKNFLEGNFGENNQLLYTSISNLIDWMWKFYKKPIYVLIDGFDSGVSKLLTKQMRISDKDQKANLQIYIGKATILIKDLLGSISAHNDRICHSRTVNNIFVFGVSDIIQLGDGLFKANVRDTLEKTQFPGLFGFTSHEIRKLMQNHSIEQSMWNSILEQMKANYGGYEQDKFFIYTPRSVLLHLHHILLAKKENKLPKPLNYWGRNRANQFLESLLSINNKTLMHLKKLTIRAVQLSPYMVYGKYDQWNSCLPFQDEQISKYHVLYYLKRYGFLAQIKRKEMAFYLLPNQEVAYHYKLRILPQWLLKIFGYTPSNIANQIAQSLYHPKKFEQLLQTKMFDNELPKNSRDDYKQIVQGVYQIAVLFNKSLQNATFASMILDEKIIDVLADSTVEKSKILMITQYDYQDQEVSVDYIIDCGFQKIYFLDYLGSIQAIQKRLKDKLGLQKYEVDFVIIRSIAFLKRQNMPGATVAVKQHKFKREDIKKVQTFFSYKKLINILEQIEYKQQCKTKKTFDQMSEQQIRKEFLESYECCSYLLSSNKVETLDQLIKPLTLTCAESENKQQVLLQNKKPLANMSPKTKNKRIHQEYRKNDHQFFFGIQRHQMLEREKHQKSDLHYDEEQDSEENAI